MENSKNIATDTVSEFMSLFESCSDETKLKVIRFAEILKEQGVDAAWEICEGIKRPSA